MKTMNKYYPHQPSVVQKSFYNALIEFDRNLIDNHLSIEIEEDGKTSSISFTFEEVDKGTNVTIECASNSQYTQSIIDSAFNSVEKSIDRIEAQTKNQPTIEVKPKGTIVAQKPKVVSPSPQASKETAYIGLKAGRTLGHSERRFKTVMDNIRAIAVTLYNILGVIASIGIVVLAIFFFITLTSDVALAILIYIPSLAVDIFAAVLSFSCAASMNRDEKSWGKAITSFILFSPIAGLLYMIWEP